MLRWWWSSETDFRGLFEGRGKGRGSGDRRLSLVSEDIVVDVECLCVRVDAGAVNWIDN